PAEPSARLTPSRGLRRMGPEPKGRRVPSQAPIAPSSAASAREARPDTGSIVSEPSASVCLEHDLVSGVIFAAAVAGALGATSRPASLGTWWSRAVRAASRAGSGWRRRQGPPGNPFPAGAARGARYHRGMRILVHGAGAVGGYFG